MTTVQLIHSNVNEAKKALLTSQGLSDKFAELSSEYLANNRRQTSLDREEAAKSALIDMYFDGDFRAKN